jgi:hypothetical protein
MPYSLVRLACTDDRAWIITAPWFDDHDDGTEARLEITRYRDADFGGQNQAYQVAHDRCAWLNAKNFTPAPSASSFGASIRAALTPSATGGAAERGTTAPPAKQEGTHQ